MGSVKIDMRLTKLPQDCTEAQTRVEYRVEISWKKQSWVKYY